MTRASRRRSRAWISDVDAPVVYSVQITHHDRFYYRIDTLDRSEADVWLVRMLYHLRELSADEPDYMREMKVSWSERTWERFG